jgi:beta-lactamase regulating signal transducer with metallopeptidase domain
MSFFAASPFLKALGWALLNSLWQFSLLCLIYWLIVTGIKKITAAVKHAIAIYLLFAGSLLFIISLCWKYYFFQPANAAASGFIIENPLYYDGWRSARSLTDALMPYCAIVYITWIFILFIKFSLFVMRANQLQQSDTQKMSAAWRTHVKIAAEQLGIKKQVNLLLSLHVDTPQVMGFFKPIILVPVACLTHLTTTQLEAILLHELVHIKRNDYLVNLFIACTEIFFFFNPFVNLLINAIRKEREYSCDDMVMQFQYHPQQYALALLTLEKNRTTPVTLGIAASGKNKKELLARIERIVGIKNKHPYLPTGKAYWLPLVLMAFIAAINPAKMVTGKTDTQTLQNTQPIQLAKTELLKSQYYKDYIPVIINGNQLKEQEKNHSQKKNILSKSAAPVKEEETDNSGGEEWQAALIDGENIAEGDVQSAASSVNLDYSLPETPVAEAPAPELATTTPYIPANSFSYQLIQDTAAPKIKAETYKELMARESLTKTRKAIDNINWQKIEKQLKYSSHTVAKLKSEITSELTKLNWQAINNEAQSELQAERMQKTLEAVRQEKLLRQYQQTEVYSEMLNKKLLERTQLLQETDKRMEQNQQQLLLKQKKLLEEMKKRRIVYI